MSFFLTTTLLFVAFLLAGYLFRRRVLTPLRRRAELAEDAATAYHGLSNQWMKRWVDSSLEIDRLTENVTHLSLELTKSNGRVRLFRSFAESMEQSAESYRKVGMYRAKLVSHLRARIGDLEVRLHNAESRQKKYIAELEAEQKKCFPQTTITYAEALRRGHVKPRTKKK